MSADDIDKVKTGLVIKGSQSYKQLDDEEYNDMFDAEDIKQPNSAQLDPKIKSLGPNQPNYKKRNQV